MLLASNHALFVCLFDQAVSGTLASWPMVAGQTGGGWQTLPISMLHLIAYTRQEHHEHAFSMVSDKDAILSINFDLGREKDIGSISCK